MKPISSEEIESLRKEYPDCPLILLPEKDPLEVIVELPQVLPHQKSAIALISKSAPHHHEETIEVYEVLQGTLFLESGDGEYFLKPGDSPFIIYPKIVHWARTEGEILAKVRVTSCPPWRSTDHHLELDIHAS
ncbi:MAG TPA: cupin domain-containing protein [Candidatus Paceibacterota bacterium]|nr:cupin domain-containing protein [Candidatus Paceibacterota bacterium]